MIKATHVLAKCYFILMVLVEALVWLFTCHLNKLAGRQDMFYYITLVYIKVHLKAFPVLFPYHSEWVLYNLFFNVTFSIGHLIFFTFSIRHLINMPSQPSTSTSSASGSASVSCLPSAPPSNSRLAHVPFLCYKPTFIPYVVVRI